MSSFLSSYRIVSVVDILAHGRPRAAFFARTVLSPFSKVLLMGAHEQLF